MLSKALPKTTNDNNYHLQQVFYLFMINKTRGENMTTITTNNIDTVQVEISSKLLSYLLNSGLLHCGDCKCLNANAKTVIWHNLLASSTSCNALDGEEVLCA